MRKKNPADEILELLKVLIIVIAGIAILTMLIRAFFSF